MVTAQRSVHGAGRADEAGPVRPPAGAADAAARVGVEFGTFLPAEVIDEVIRECHRELDAPSADVSREVLERRTRQRLIERVRAGGAGTRSSGAPEG
ncbi:hypothetical protein EV383_5974 [Pseudonocardia sediminis]|uniref:Uncharacterized protein n=1 Tax=Pseudonocardia sediminis TaxID=1397368 RepID=A0A4V2FRK8_PSEST|nr:hypothetical protein [Pseudonocardia sediminis]RZT89020.1 hypothetical protein EV383_5974 [Pseudonocardia sediminis]